MWLNFRNCLPSSLLFYVLLNITKPFIVKDCHEFKAGEVNDMIRSKGRNKLFDEKGVFGCVCRHDYPKGFMNIKHGERYFLKSLTYFL